MKTTILPPEDPQAVRLREGLSPAASFYTTRRRRTAAYKSMQNKPSSEIHDEHTTRPRWEAM